MVRARRGTTCSAANSSTRATSSSARPSTDSTVAAPDPQVQLRSSIAWTSARAWDSTASTSVSGASGFKPNAVRSPGTACDFPPHTWAARRMDSTRFTRASPSGAPPSTCRPSRICASFTSHSQPSTCRRKSSNSASCGRSSRPRSWSSFAAWISVQICARIAGSFAGSIAAMLEYSSSSCSKRAMSP